MAGAPEAAAPLVVGIGASAGGLEALLTLLPLLPRQGLAYVLAPHMANAAHGELLLRLLQRGTELPVALARDGQALRPGQVCLAPPGSDVLVQGARLRLVPPLPGQVSKPSVNRLLASLAACGGARVAGLVLSGAGSDGAQASKTLREAGGLVLVQDPQEAKFDGMPMAALQALGPGVQGLPLARMARALAEWSAPATATFAAPASAPPPPTSPFSDPEGAVDAPAALQRQELAQVLPLLQAVTGVDFSGYKEDTLLRGLAKRKAVLGLGDAPPPAYRNWLAGHPDEAWRLQGLFLVTVSSFFRDPDAFVALERALQSALTRLPPGQGLRVWVPACAGGEEAYSLAMLLHALLEREGAGLPARTFTIFATDLNRDALALAREGRYRAAALHHVPAALRARYGPYFLPQGDAVQVCAAIRERVQWTEGNLLTQSPPEHLDLVSCRNLLIYLQASAQVRLLARFHASLRPQGLLFIGQAESVAWDSDALFTPLDYFHRIFVRKDPPLPPWAPVRLRSTPSNPAP